MAEPVRVQLLVREFELVLPKSHTVRYEIAAAGSVNAQRALGAALGVCSPRILQAIAKEGGPKLTYAYQPLVFGGEVIDALLGLGVPIDHIMTAGTKAYELIAASLVSAAEVESAMGNSAPSTGTASP